MTRIAHALAESSPAWSAGTMALLDEVSRGLPVGAVDELAARIAPGERTFKFHLVSKASYARRLANGGASGAALSKAESERVTRLSRLWAFAVEVWGGEGAARRFLRKPHMFLDGKAPLDVALTSELGGRMVEDILGRLAYGSAA
jgi:putative toxin-antitoxin system antitoxin component (TIGR02293 family)